VAVTTGQDEIMLGTRNGQTIRFEEGNVRSMGRTAAGVRGLNLKGDDEVVDMIVVDEQASLLTMCEHGYGKRTAFDEYRKQGRGGSGIINIKTTDRNGKVVGMKSIRDTDELMLITQKGKIVRTGISEMRIIGRATQGVRVITMKANDLLVAIAKVMPDDEADTDDSTAEGQVEVPTEGQPAEQAEVQTESQAPEQTEE
jgi:DNA gyrase subunit A